jgi:hypothetical protein
MNVFEMQAQEIYLRSLFGILGAYSLYGLVLIMLAD